MSGSKPTLDGLRIERPAVNGGGRWAWAVLVALVLLALGAGGGYLWWRQAQAAEVRTAVAREIEAGGPRTLLNGSGYVTARREATVSSKVTGKVLEVMIEEGMKVEAGQALARLDDTNLRDNLHLAEAQLAAGQAALAETRVNLERSDKEYRRTVQLAEARIASVAQLDAARAERDSFQARLDKLAADVQVGEREVALWRQQVADMEIRAPFAGVVTVKSAQPGEMISPISAGGGFTRTGICTIVDMASLEIEVDVGESYINRLAAGQPVQATLDAYPEWKIPARLIAIIPTADRQKATVKVRVGFEKLDPRILPQMGVKVAFHDAQPGGGGNRAVGVPKAALQKLEGRDIVLVVRNGRLERRAVTVGAAGQDPATILAGLAAGEKVVLGASPTLGENQRVRESKD